MEPSPPVGPFQAPAFFGVSPQRLESWARITGWVLNPWQAETVLLASQAYAQVAQNPKIPPPWAGYNKNRHKAKLSAGIKGALRAITKG